MWARIAELILGGFLAISPLIFSDSPSSRSGLICSLLIFLFSLLSFSARLNKMHLFNLAIAIWLIGFGWSHPPTPAMQSHLILGLLLSMIALVPSNATQPPASWQQFYTTRRLKK
jgi:hypothetical protein